ncbi:diadenylate cyclase CdaA [uncultured Victivallis sp.]|uniref:diadenylate cyclase CdaA n=1 Tax=uncultured Victivallis sp. TaxID=354118 RepID=UPI0025FBA289|nr:diadenylate cyclase CdaA [uncultured Victivallis sp.]
MLDTLFSVPTVVIVDYLKMALEIFILTVVIYKTLHYLRGARGASVLAGITIALLALTWLSKQLRLDVLNWLLTGIWGTVGAAVVIIFQPELRRAFAQLGSFSFFKGKRQREVLTEIVNAATNMARRKCGALMVIERRIGLQNLVDDSVKLDIKVNAMILESIFYPNSPLHDGAVIIRDDRIVAARAILPLTRAENISIRLGTRHRASLGISEETDAVTVVVSEETGAISVACRGVLYRDLSPEELANYLEKLVILEQDDADLAETVQMLEEQADRREASANREGRS